MLRALLARLNLTKAPSGGSTQLELSFGAGTSSEPPTVTPEGAPRRGAPTAPRPHLADDTRPAPAHEPARAVTAALMRKLRSFGLHPSVRLTLTTNRSVMVSFRGGTLRLHRGFADAPDDVLRAVVVFMQGRGVARRAAKRVLLAHRIPREDHAPPRRERMHPDDAPLAARLAKEHARLNDERFGGTLRPLTLRVSRRMKSRLGHYAPASSAAGAEIVISRRHIRRHGWPEALETLLHEMVHQWQDESGSPVDHGAGFREKAREVGILPRARRTVD